MISSQVVDIIFFYGINLLDSARFDWNSSNNNLSEEANTMSIFVKEYIEMCTQYIFSAWFHMVVCLSLVNKNSLRNGWMVNRRRGGGREFIHVLILYSIQNRRTEIERRTVVEVLSSCVVDKHFSLKNI